MSIPPYKVKPRPNIFELAIMDGFLNGGGNLPTVQREAYWAAPPSENPDAFFIYNQRDKHKP